MRFRNLLLFCFTLILANQLCAQVTKLKANAAVSQNGIQFVTVSDDGETGQAAGYWNKNDFLTFSINPSKDGVYQFSFRVGSNIGTARYELRDEANGLLATINPPNTGSHGIFATIQVPVTLKKGKQNITYTSVEDNAGADLFWIGYEYAHEAGAPTLELVSDTTFILIDPAKPLRAKLKASARDDDGRIQAYQWKKLSGKGQLDNTSSDEITLDGLGMGETILQLTVTDNDKKTTSRNVRVIVKKCGGKKILISPVDGNGSGLSLQANDYDRRKIYYPDPGYNPGWRFPKIKVNAGDTIALRAQYQWSYLDLFGIEGVAGCPVVITSDSGTVHIDRGIRLADARYVKVTGRGRNETLSSYPSGNEKFRIDIRGVDMIGNKKGFGFGGIAIEIIGRSAHVEIDMIRAERKGYGVQAKQDPTCDTAYNYPNWVMDDIHIHHCFFKSILQDVLYLGNTDPLGKRQIVCSTGIAYPKPMRLSNFNIHHNRILIANRTGIQLGGAETGHNEIHHNFVSDCGYEFNQQQGAGISIGGMSRNVRVHDNIIKRTFLYGIFDLGADSSYVYNNFVDSSGFLDIALFNPGMRVDSLAGALGIAEARGRFLLNRNAAGITNIQSTTKETFPHYTKTVYYMNNVLGINTSKRDSTGIISFSEWGPAADWTEDNVVCGNTHLNGKPVTVETFRSRSGNWPAFSEDCADSPVNGKKGGSKKKTSPSISRIMSPKLIAGSAVSIGVIVALYFVYRKRFGG